MKKTVVLIGGGGHCKSVIDVAEYAGYTILGVLDKPERVGRLILGYKVIGTDDDIERFVNVAKFVVTLGQIKSPDRRIELHRIVERVGGQLATIISPTACVSKYASIGEGTVIMHQAVINANAKIGRGCIINTFANIEHDVEIGDYCHISTGAMVNGGCTVSNGTFVGSGAIISNQLSVGANSVIGAGAVVVKSLPSNCIAIGIPASIIKDK